jgi:hypothetical protein
MKSVLRNNLKLAHVLIHPAVAEGVQAHDENGFRHDVRVETAK